MKIPFEEKPPPFFVFVWIIRPIPETAGTGADGGAREDFGWFPVEIPRTSAAGSLSASGTGRIGKRQMYYRKKRQRNQELIGKKSSREAHGRALPAAFPQDIGNFNNF